MISIQQRRRVAFWGLLIACLVMQSSAHAQINETPIADAADIESLMSDVGPQEAQAVEESTGIDLLSLIFRGGMFMIPIAIMSLMVVMLSVERMLSLRRRNVIPRAFVREMRGQVANVSSFNPEEAFRTCQRYRSAGSRVIRAMLLRTGQPLSQVEHAANETAQREADRLAAPIRWLNLAAAATPLMGLLGTVWGMIVAFHDSTTLSADRSRSEQLSEGIYTALVTTLAGLVVAIPAAMLAMYLENRLIRLFHHMEQLAFDVAPGLARFTGNSRLDADGTLHRVDDGIARTGAASVAKSATPSVAKKNRSGTKTR